MSESDIEKPEHAIASSDWVGHTGPGQVAESGVRDTSGAGDALPVAEDPTVDDVDEPQPEGITPKAGYPSLDPRSEDKPFESSR